MLAAKRSQCQTPSGMTQRFIARARSEGIEMSRGAAARVMNRNRPFLVAAMGAVAAVVLIAGVFTSRKIHPSSSVANQAQSPAQQVAVTPAAVPSSTSRVQDSELQQQLTAARKEMSSRPLRSERSAMSLKLWAKVKDSLNSQLMETERQNTSSELRRLNGEPTPHSFRHNLRSLKLIRVRATSPDSGGG